MELTPPREARGRSVELDGRRINAVHPMHVGESVLQNLWKEHQQQQQQVANVGSNQHSMDQKSSKASGSSGEENDRKLQHMLEKYQSQVKLQQRTQSNAQNKTISRNNLHKIGKIASQRVPNMTQHTNQHGHPMSHSQPCLIAISDRPPEYAPQPIMSQSTYQRRSSGSGSGEQHNDGAHNGGNQRIANNPKLIQSLREENVHLKREVETLKKKLTKLTQIESAYERIESEYENLLREKDRQDSVEKNAILQFELHLKRTMQEKEVLQDRLESSYSYQAAQQMEKFNQLNMMLADLIPQNKELQACKDRMRVELDAQAATLEEQRTHIAIVEKALSNAQDRLAKREKMCDEMTKMTERGNMLQRQLHDALLDKQDRDELHANERSAWEMEMAQLRMQLNKDASLNGSLKRSGGGARLSIDGGDEMVQRLKKTIYSKDEKITQLERTVVDLQRKLHEECERRSSGIFAMTENFEAKIKRLEEEKSEKDRRIAELMEEKEKLGVILDSGERGDLFFARDRDAATNLNKMEEIRQKIQERKRKGRIGPTGGLIGFTTVNDQSPSSGPMMQSHGHQRTSSGPFDTSLIDQAMLSELSLSSYKKKNSADIQIQSQKVGGFSSTVTFKNGPHDIMTRTA